MCDGALGCPVSIKPALWRYPIQNYEKMVIHSGKDRATGEEAETASEMRKRGHSTAEHNFIEPTDDLDNRMSRNEVTLEDFDAYGDGGSDNMSNFSAHEIQSKYPSLAISSGRQKKKSKVASKKEKDIELHETKGAMHEVAEAIKDCAAALREGNAIMKELYQPPISGEETWKLIKECGCDTRLFPKIYCSLMLDFSNLRTVLQCPVQARKKVIMFIVFGTLDPPSY